LSVDCILARRTLSSIGTLRVESLSTTQVCASRFRSVLQCIQEGDGRFVGQVFVVVVVDLNHGGVRARAEALDFGHGEKAVLGSLAVVDAQSVFASFHDSVAVAEHAWGLLQSAVLGAFGGGVSTYRCADLDVELARGVPVVHGVERGDLVYTHGWHLQYPCNLIHDADTGEAMLALAEVEQRHDGGFLVL
jgi:hypothetical protein